MFDRVLNELPIIPLTYKPGSWFFLVEHLKKIDTAYLSVFSPNVGKYGPEKLRIWILFTLWVLYRVFSR